MIHSSFPKQGTERRAHEGSQSRTGTQVAGDVVEFPKTLKDADAQRMSSQKAISQGYIPKTGGPAVPLRPEYQ